MALRQPHRWTYEEYCALPDDGRRYEVIGGKLYVAPSPTIAHQRAAFRLGRLLAGFVERNDLGEVLVAPTDVVLARDTVVQPDVLFVRKDRAAIITRANIAGSPDLVVEVLSPGTETRDRRNKRDAYAAHGVPHFWLADPEARTLEAYELQGGAYVLVQRCTSSETFGPASFPGLAIPLPLLWDEPPQP